MCTVASQEGADALSPDCVVVHGRYVSQEHLFGMLHHLWKVSHEPAGQDLTSLHQTDARRHGQHASPGKAQLTLQTVQLGPSDERPQKLTSCADRLSTH